MLAGAGELMEKPEKDDNVFRWPRTAVWAVTSTGAEVEALSRRLSLLPRS